MHNIVSKWAFPCGKQCPVSACCKVYCINVIKYANMIADNMSLMTTKQLEIYRDTTPLVVRSRIMILYSHGGRMALPEKSTISRDWK